MNDRILRSMTIGPCSRVGLTGVLALSAALFTPAGAFARGGGPGGAGGATTLVKEKGAESSEEPAKQKAKSEPKDSEADKDNGKGNDDRVAKAWKSKAAPCSKCKGGGDNPSQKCLVCKKKSCTGDCACHGGNGGSYASDEDYEAGALANAPEDADAAGSVEPSPGDPVAYWRFDESAGVTITDHAGIQHGTLTGGALSGGKASSVRTFRMDLDGGNDWMSTGSSLPWFSGTFSVSYWVKTTAEGDDDISVAPALIGHDDSDNSRDLVYGYIDWSGGIAAKVGTGPAVHSRTVVNDGRWHHVVVTRDAAIGRVQVFVDGALEQAKTGPSGTLSSSLAGLGRVKSTLSTPTVDENTYFAGSLSEVKVYGTVLTAGQVRGLLTAAMSNPRVIKWAETGVK